MIFLLRALSLLVMGALLAAAAVPSKVKVGGTGECKNGTHMKLIPLPVYSTDPNEGSTFGAMPVFLKVCNDISRVETILAPSVSWNSVIGVTGTFRWYEYPSETQSFVTTASASTHVNWGTLVSWQNLPMIAGTSTDEFSFVANRSIFYRFFGFGPDSNFSDQTSYTRTRELASYRKGVNITERLNAGIGIEGVNDSLLDIGVPGLPLTRTYFPNLPGADGSTLLSEFLDLRFDSRPDYDYSTHGLFVDLRTSAVEGLTSSPSYTESRADARVLIRERSGASGAVHLYANYVYSPNVPFYDQTSLGGADILRGFNEGRFIDQGGWAAEFEQRTRVFQTHIYDVTTDWRIDPFFAMGQVFHDIYDVFSHTRTAVGVGFRAWVRPSIVGRVDAAYSTEGLMFYVELGYPF